MITTYKYRLLPSKRQHQALQAILESNHLHQATARLVKAFDVIAVEALNVKGLAAGPYAKDVNDAAWGRFIAMLEYKAARAGIRLIEVDPWGHDAGMLGMRL